MVIYGNGYDFFCPLLLDDVIVQIFFYNVWLVFLKQNVQPIVKFRRFALDNTGLIGFDFVVQLFYAIFAYSHPDVWIPNRHIKPITHRDNIIAIRTLTLMIILFFPCHNFSH